MYDQSWENSYAKGMQLNLWPFDLVVSIVSRFCDHQNERPLALDLGCGAGNNALFLAEKGYNVVGVDASQSAISFCQKRFIENGMVGDFIVSDLIDYDFGETRFDLIIDRESLYCNAYDDIRSIVGKAYNAMLPGGYFLSFMYNDFHPGVKGLKDLGSYKDGTYYLDVPSADFSGSRVMTIFSEEMVRNLFEKFRVDLLVNHSVDPIVGGEGMSEYIILAKKV